MVTKQLVPNFIERMALETESMIPFGTRYAEDKRYRPMCIAGHGNGHHDTYYGVVGGYQFKLYVERGANRHAKCTLLDAKDYFII